MKHSVKEHSLRAAVLMGGTLLSAQAAQANTTFTSSAALTYTINSITNLNGEHPNDLSGLEVTGSFEQPSDYLYVYTRGDGAVGSNDAGVLPFAVGSSFSHSFAVSGSALNGTVDSYHTGWFKLDFINNGADSYAIDLTLAYQLDTEVNGLLANSHVALDYGYTGNDFVGTDHAEAFTFEGYSSDTNSVSGSSGLIFTLDSGASEIVYADAVITGNLESASAIPVPAAVWFFASGLLGFTGLNRRNLHNDLNKI